VFRATITTSGYGTPGHRFPAVSKHVQIRNSGANVLRVYFLEEDYTADANYLEVAATSFWEGPAELERIWLRSVTGDAAIEIVSFCRRG
jgi:hypothetical protein